MTIIPNWCVKACAAASVGLATMSFFPALSDTPTPSVPTEIQSLYSQTPDSQVSDEFNSSTLDTSRWQWRLENTTNFASGNDTFTPTTDSALVPSGSGITSLPYVELKSHSSPQTGGYIAIRGSHEANKGSGITTKSNRKYGFVMFRWSVSGIEDIAPSRWHPAIWGAGCDFSASHNCIAAVTNKTHRIELDAMEGFQSSSISNWNSHILAWNGSSAKGFGLKSKYGRWPELDDNDWELMGLEYNPEYVRLWLHHDTDGWRVHKTVKFASAAQLEAGEMDDRYRQNTYWILSNLGRNVPAAGNQDSAINVDFFRFYPHSSGSYFPSNNDAGIVDGNTYKIRNPGSNTYLTLEYSPSSGDPVVMRPARTGANEDTQRWQFDADVHYDGYYYVKSAHSNYYLRCYETPENSAENGKNVTVYPSNPSGWFTLKWRPYALMDAGGNKALDCRFGSAPHIRAYDPFRVPMEGDGAHATLRAPYEDWPTMKWEFIEDND